MPYDQIVGAVQMKAKVQQPILAELETLQTMVYVGREFGRLMISVATSSASVPEDILNFTGLMFAWTIQTFGD